MKKYVLLYIKANNEGNYYLINNIFIAEKDLLPQFVENVVYSYDPGTKMFTKSYRETGDLIWDTKVKSTPVYQFKTGEYLYAALQSEEITAINMT